VHIPCPAIHNEGNLEGNDPLFQRQKPLRTGKDTGVPGVVEESGCPPHLKLEPHLKVQIAPIEEPEDTRSYLNKVGILGTPDDRDHLYPLPPDPFGDTLEIRGSSANKELFFFRENPGRGWDDLQKEEEGKKNRKEREKDLATDPSNPQGKEKVFPVHHKLLSDDD
jgi:hypothetical protein